MTGRIGAMAIDGTLISESDVARMQAEETLHQEWQRKAVRVVAASSENAGDCRELLAMLGLDSAVVADARGNSASPSSPKVVRKRRAAAA